MPRALVCTQATLRFTMKKIGVEILDEHLVAMTGSNFPGDAEAVMHPDHEAKFDTVNYTHYEQNNGYLSAPTKARKAPSLMLRPTLRFGCAAFNAVDVVLVLNSNASTSG